MNLFNVQMSVCLWWVILVVATSPAWLLFIATLASDQLWPIWLDLFDRLFTGKNLIFQLLLDLTLILFAPVWVSALAIVLEIVLMFLLVLIVASLAWKK